MMHITQIGIYSIVRDLQKVEQDGKGQDCMHCLHPSIPFAMDQMRDETNVTVSQSSNPKYYMPPSKKRCLEVYDIISLHGETTKSSCTGYCTLVKKIVIKIAFIWRSQHHRWHRADA